MTAYRNNQKVSSAQTTAETKKATIRLLRTIVVLSQSLHSLPDEVMMTMKLLYYDDGINMDKLQTLKNYLINCSVSIKK